MNLLGVMHHEMPGQRPGEGPRRSAFNQAYESLVGKGGYVKVAPRNGETFRSKPKDYFAHAGKLAKMLLEGHKDEEGKVRVHLDRDSFQRIVDWLDLNAQFYGDYSFNRVEDQPIAPDGETALREAVRRRFGAEFAEQPFAALVNIALPSQSRILLAALPENAGGWGQIAEGAWQGTSDPAYREMLKLVEGSITPRQYVDVAGTCGRGNGCRCGGCFVRLDFENRQKRAEELRRLMDEAKKEQAATAPVVAPPDEPAVIRKPTTS